MAQPKQSNPLSLKCSFCDTPNLEEVTNKIPVFLRKGNRFFTCPQCASTHTIKAETLETILSVKQMTEKQILGE